jgi:hypothetical protein
VPFLTFDYGSADHPFSLVPPPDFHHIDLLAHFDRERIPERVVCIMILGVNSRVILISNLLGSCEGRRRTWLL